MTAAPDRLGAAFVGSYPDQTALVRAVSIPDWVDRNFLRGDPYAFRHGSYQEFVFQCGASFGVDPNAVFCLGSGAIGLSLNPSKISDGQLKPFDEQSDLDVALISDYHFELAWRELRHQAHPAYGPTDSGLQAHLSWQRKRLFDGAILTNLLLPLLSFGPAWQLGLIQVEQTAAEQVGREISVHFWVFRDYWSVRSTVARSLLDCRAALR